MRSGSLTLVGTGYAMAGQVTQQALACIEKADKLFYLVVDAMTSSWLEGLNPSAESLYGCYGVGKERMDSYLEMVERMLAPVREGRRVCTAFYGHPGVCVFPAHEAIRRARSEGYLARMLPGISSVDCLFAELGVDPGTNGCQMYEASSFVYRRRRYDPTSPLILWQIGSIGISTFQSMALWGVEGLGLLAEILLQDYPPDHEVVVYETTQLAICRPKVLRTALRDLPSADVSVSSTLYVPPLDGVDFDWDAVRRLTSTEA